MLSEIRSTTTEKRRKSSIREKSSRDVHLGGGGASSAYSPVRKKGKSVKCVSFLQRALESRRGGGG